MTNLINSQNINCDNIVAAKKLSSENKTGGRYIEAPQYLPKYSIEKTLKEKDEFRKEVIQLQNKSLNKKKNNILPKILVCLAAAAGFFIVKGGKTLKK